MALSLRDAGRFPPVAVWKDWQATKGTNAPMAWHDTDDFWLTFEPTMFPPERFAAAVADLDGLLALAAPPEGAQVLDMCCGPGRHSLELARRGFRVTGVDRTAGYLARAREAAAQENLQIEFVQSDARAFSRPAAFDLALNLYTSFGYFEDPAGDRRMAQALREALRPGGKLVMELMGKEVLARVFVTRFWNECEGVFRLGEAKMLPVTRMSRAFLEAFI